MADPELIWHYTDINGLQGILEHGFLRATYYRFMNDDREFNLGKELVETELRSEINAATGAQRETLELVLRQFTSYVQTMAPFIASFCGGSEGKNAGDSLQLWMAYGARGEGYAIGFDRQELGALTEAQDSMMMRRVEYQPSEQVEHARNAVRRALSAEKDAVTTALAAAWELQVTCKDESWAHEGEWRVACVRTDEDTDPPSVYSRRNVLVPFVPISVGTEPDSPLKSMRRIMVGPIPAARFGKDSMLGIKTQLTRKKAGHVDVDTSRLSLK